MNESAIIKKKQLLRKRTELLEEIGQAIFEEKELPAEFEFLHQEFSSMDVLLNQLKDRNRILREEKDRAYWDYNELLRKLNHKVRGFEKQLACLKQDYDEAKLKLQYRQDQLAQKKQKLPADDFEELMEEEARLRQKVEQLEAEKQREVAKIQKEIKPWEVRIDQLDKAIMNVLEEEGRLSFNRRKRLRDLGHYYHAQKPDSPSFGVKYGQLKLIQMELAASLKNRPPEEVPTSKKRANTSWLWLTALLVALMGIGYLSRTQFGTRDMSLDAIGEAFMADQPDLRVMADLDLEDVVLASDMVPRFANLPGGEAAFEGFNRSDIRAFVIARENSAGKPLRFCGLKLGRTPTRFGFRLIQQGWRYRATTLNLRALTNGDWVWLVFQDRAFFLLPASALDEFEAFDHAGGGESLRISRDIQPFGNNRPLLQGFHRFQLTKSGDQYRLSLFADQPLPDLPLRRQFVRSLGLNRGTDPSFGFGANSLRLSGSWATLNLQESGLDDLPEKITQLVDRSLASIGEQAPVNAPDLQEIDLTPWPASPNQRLLTYRVRDGALKLVDDQSIGLALKDLGFNRTNNGLYVLDGEGQCVYRFNFNGQKPVLKDRLYFPDAVPGNQSAAEGQSFQPALLRIAPDDRSAVVLEAPRSRAYSRLGNARLALISMNDLSLLWRDELPKGVREGYAAVWDPTGETLFLGCDVAKRRGSSAIGVLVYRREGNSLSLSRFVELSKQGSLLQVPSLEAAGNHLFLLKTPQQQLVRYQINDGRAEDSYGFIGNPGTIDRSLLTPGPSRLLLNRSKEIALVTDPPGGEVGGNHNLVYLLDLRGERIKLLDRMDLKEVPASIVKRKLTDQFWMCQTQSKAIGSLKIEKGLLVLGPVHPVPYHPKVIEMDQWGTTLFVLGETGP